MNRGDVVMNETQIIELADQLIEERDYGALRELMSMIDPLDIARFFSQLQSEKLLLLFRILPKEIAAETFVEMDGDCQQLLLAAFSDREIREVFDELYFDDTVDIIEEMPANVVWRILKNTDRDTRQAINKVLEYPENSAGSIMTIEYVSLNRDLTVDEAFKRIKCIGPDKETIYTCYVTDKNRTLLGIITAKTLMLSESDAVIGDIMEQNVISVNTHDDREAAVRLIEQYDLLALPVVDSEDRLVGIVTVDDAIDVMREETEEDFAKMAAVSPSEGTYLKTSVFKHSRGRIVWLLIMMLSAAVTGSLLERYEAAFSSIPLLVVFIPMLMGTGGNCGSQSSVMIIRGMATGEIRLNDFFRVLFKEIGIGITVGIVLALVNAARVLIMYRDYDQCLQMTVVLGLSLIAIAVIAKALGCILPMLAKCLKLDPAIMASPIITTVVDTCAVLIYFNIAVAMLRL